MECLFEDDLKHYGAKIVFFRKAIFSIASVIFIYPYKQLVVALAILAELLDCLD